MTYSTLTACASDSAASGHYGYIFENCSGVTLNSCGAEANTKVAFDVAATAAVGSGATVPNVHGIVFNGCFGTNNGTDSGAVSFLNVLSQDSKNANITLIGCVDMSSPSGTSASVSGTGNKVIKIGGTYAGSLTAVSSGTLTNLA